MRRADGNAPPEVTFSMRIKHIAAYLLLLMIILTLMPRAPGMGLSAAVYNNFSYNSINNEITITKYNGSDISIEVPGEINGIQVTKIAPNAFLYADTVKSILIPASVTDIGITFDGSVPPVSWCPTAEAVLFEAGSHFYSMDGIVFTSSGQLLYIPEGLSGGLALNAAEIPSWTFYNNKKITALTLIGTTSIRGSAFEGCSSLKRIGLPSSLTEIHSRAFSGCSSLTTVTIPASCYVGAEAFYGCESLSELIVGFTYADTGKANMLTAALAGVNKSGQPVSIHMSDGAVYRYAEDGTLALVSPAPDTPGEGGDTPDTTAAPETPVTTGQQAEPPVTAPVTTTAVTTPKATTTARTTPPAATTARTEPPATTAKTTAAPETPGTTTKPVPETTAKPPAGVTTRPGEPTLKTTPGPTEPAEPTDAAAAEPSETPGADITENEISTPSDAEKGDMIFGKPAGSVVYFVMCAILCSAGALVILSVLKKLF